VLAGPVLAGPVLAGTAGIWLDSADIFLQG